MNGENAVGAALRPILSSYTGMLLDLLEITISPQSWEVLRPKVLKILGNRGLERALLTALAREEGDDYGNV